MYSLGMMRVLPLMLALFAVGCAKPPDCEGSYHAHRSLSAEQTSQVQVAFAKWNAFVGRDVVRLEPGDEDDTTCSVRVDESTGDLGLFRHDDASISFAPDYMREHAAGCTTHLADCIEATLLHETGHALGLLHVPGAGNVMSADGELVLDFTDADRAECTRVGVCR